MQKLLNGNCSVVKKNGKFYDSVDSLSDYVVARHQLDKIERVQWNKLLNNIIVNKMLV